KFLISQCIFYSSDFFCACSAAQILVNQCFCNLHIERLRLKNAYPPKKNYKFVSIKMPINSAFRMVFKASASWFPTVVVERDHFWAISLFDGGAKRLSIKICRRL